jgi:hypothetical protein
VPPGLSSEVLGFFCGCFDPCQPARDDPMLMGGVIIQNDVDALTQRNFAIDLFQIPAIGGGMFLGGVSDDFALQIIQRGKESDCAVAVVIVGFTADVTFPGHGSFGRA